jgi:hypothetical protein
MARFGLVFFQTQVEIGLGSDLVLALVVVIAQMQRRYLASDRINDALVIAALSLLEEMNNSRATVELFVEQIRSS